MVFSASAEKEREYEDARFDCLADNRAGNNGRMSLATSPSLLRRILQTLVFASPLRFERESERPPPSKSGVWLTSNNTPRNYPKEFFVYRRRLSATSKNGRLQDIWSRHEIVGGKNNRVSTDEFDHLFDRRFVRSTETRHCRRKYSLGASF